MAKEIWETQNYEYVVSRLSLKDINFILKNNELRKTEDYWIIAKDAIFQGISTNQSYILSYLRFGNQGIPIFI